MRDEIIKEDTAKLAKEVGFDWGCSHVHGEVDGYVGLHAWDNYNRICNDKQFSAPSQAKLQRWLRENHGINVDSITGCNASGFMYFCSISRMADGCFKKEYITSSNEEGLRKLGLLTPTIFNIPELAIEQGLRTALQILKNGEKMKELEGQAKEKIGIYQEKNQKQEYKFIGTIRVKTGCKLWAWDSENDKMNQVAISDKGLIDIFGNVIQNRKAQHNPKYTYFQAINEKNAMKKLSKFIAGNYAIAETFEQESEFMKLERF